MLSQNWLDRSGPTSWSLCTISSDLNPSDSYFQSHSKSIVYSTPVNNEDDLQEKNLVGNGFETIRGISNILNEDKMWSSLYWRMKQILWTFFSSVHNLKAKICKTYIHSRFLLILVYKFILLVLTCIYEILYILYKVLVIYNKK